MSSFFGSGDDPASRIVSFLELAVSNSFTPGDGWEQHSRNGGTLSDISW
jgi:hypothetical protein